MQSFDLVVFDMDGTLVDTELMAAEAMSEALHQQKDVVADPVELAELYRGHTFDFVAADLFGRYGITMDRVFIALIDTAYHVLIDSSLKRTDGVDATLDRLASSLPLSIVSNSERDILTHYISALGWQHMFDMNKNVFSSDDVVVGKPAPDLFLLAAERLGVKPDRCIVLEDSAPGATGALEAGMTVIGFTANHPDADNELGRLGIEIVDEIGRFADLALS